MVALIGIAALSSGETQLGRGLIEQSLAIDREAGNDGRVKELTR